jgi:hypothetical protein
MESLDTWQLLALAGALGWASGIRVYVVLFVIGMLGWLGFVKLPPGLAVLAHPLVLGASGFMLVAEFFADKIPGIDSVWDVVHTFIRIPAGAALAAGVFGGGDAAMALAAAILGGTLAAGTHFTKAAGRLAINTSPEPVSNWAASFGEDALVGVGLWTAFVHPAAFLVLLAVTVVAMVWLLPKLWRFVRRIASRIGSWFGAGIEERAR